MLLSKLLLYFGVYFTWFEIYYTTQEHNEAHQKNTYPHLKNYKIKNASKIYEVPHVKQIIAFGDSLTEGMYNNGKKFSPYTTKLEELLNSKAVQTRYHIINDGVSGECVYTEMATRLPLSIQQYSKNLKLVIILGGTNDLRKLDCNNTVNLAYEIINLHNIVHKKGFKSIVVTIPEADEQQSNLPYDYETYIDLWEKTNNKLRDFVKKNQKMTVLCDLAEEFPMHSLNEQDKERYWADNLHPTEEGYEKIAALLFKSIQKLEI